MDNSLFRKKSVERITSPESLGDYLRVTSPTVWLILVAIILILAGMMIWSSVATLNSFAAGTARVEDGVMHIRFEDEQIARNVESGMNVVVGETVSRINSVGADEAGLFASAPTELADGTYSNVKVIFRQTQVIHLLFN